MSNEAFGLIFLFVVLLLFLYAAHHDAGSGPSLRDERRRLARWTRGVRDWPRR